MPVSRGQGYNGNINLKKVNTIATYTKEQKEELRKCKKDPIYFMETYVRVISLDDGLVPFTLYPYQKKIVLSMHENRNTIIATARQVGKTTSAVGYVLWYILFNKTKTVGILANKGETSRKILASIKLAFEHLPGWLKQGVKEWNKGSIELENNCRIIAAATSSDAIRGNAINMLIIDEAAHIENWDEFFTSVYPTISSGKKTKVILISTPNGLNNFHSIWDNAEKGNNEYNPIKVMWFEAPGRDEAWRAKTLSDMNFDEQKFAQEYEVEFIGSSGTLINGGALKALASLVAKPIMAKEGVYQYEQVIKDHRYMIVADTSRGKGLDYSAFQCIDITASPYRQVCTFRDNMTLSPDYAAIIFQFAKHYNNAHVLVEINDLGQQVADLLHETYEYEYILKTTIKGRGGKQLSTGFGNNSDRGIRTTTQVKATGCAMLKMLVEQRQLHLVDDHTRRELNTFSRKNNSYEAEPGNHDDLTMGLVLFAWATDQKFFRELTDSNIVDALKEVSDEALYGDLVSFGIIVNDGMEDRQESHDWSVDPEPFSWF